MMISDHGSIPELVMRTGILRAMNPANARQDILPSHVIHMTSPHGLTTEYDHMHPAPPPAEVQAVAATAVATPPTPKPSAMPSPGLSGGIVLGSFQGKPVVAFNVNAAVPADQAQGAVLALKRAAGLLASAGHGALPPELVAGPLAALMRGGAVELHFRNGVVVRTAL